MMITASIQRSFFYKRSRFFTGILIASLCSLFACSGNTSSKDSSGYSSAAGDAASNDIQPATGKATLTLGDDGRVELNHAINGKIADQGNAEVIKVSDGELKYQPHQSSAAKDTGTTTNTLRTPKGGHYHLMLPDGTQVWLNAASSITYPATLSRARNVQLQGEAYFEVNKRPKQPFVITINDVTVEVLGTRFNINAYGDELLVNTTLLQGSLMIREGIAIEQLKAGQQAQITKTRELNIVSDIDTVDAVAWKGGFFNFDHHSLETNLRQISRWYDVTVVFEGKQPTTTLSGKIEKNIPLSVLQERLSKMGLKTRLEANRKLVVME